MLVAIRTPADNDRGPRYMEKALAGIHQANRIRSSIQLVYRSHEQQVELCVRCSDQLAAVVTAAIEAGYPDCRLETFKDDAEGEMSKQGDLDTWSAELRLVPDLFPILRHSQFEDLQSRSFADPIDSLLKAIKPDDRCSARIEISSRPASRRRRWRVKWAVERLNSPFFRVHYRLADYFARWVLTKRQERAHIEQKRQARVVRKRAVSGQQDLLDLGLATQAFPPLNRSANSVIFSRMHSLSSHSQGIPLSP